MMLKIKGFNLIEILITLLIVLILVKVAVPYFKNMIAEYQVRAAAEKFYQDLKYAQSLAINSRVNINVALSTTAPACYGFSDVGSSCNCSTQANCTLGGVTKISTLSSLITLSSTANSFYFGQLRGESSVASGQWIFTQGSFAITVNMNNIGLVSLCSSGSLKIASYLAC